MKLVNLKKVAAMSALGLVALLGTSVATNAQYGGQNKKIVKQHIKAQKAQLKADQARARAEQLRRQQLNDRRPHTTARYRVNRGGRYYNTDQRGADLLRQAVNAGYQQGYRAGQTDRRGRRNSSWMGHSVYNQGTYGYQTYVDRSQYQYYFQQGFQKGYQDGYNSRNQYGNGSSILGTILGQILNIQTY